MLESIRHVKHNDRTGALLLAILPYSIPRLFQSELSAGLYEM